MILPLAAWALEHPTESAPKSVKQFKICWKRGFVWQEGKSACVLSDSWLSSLCTLQICSILCLGRKNARLSFHANMKRQPRPSCVTWLMLRLCCASCNLAGLCGDGSHWYCQSPCFPITIACTPAWLPDWQCYFRGNYYDSDYVNHFTLCSMWHQIAAAQAAHFFFYPPPHVSDGCLRYILSFLQ